MKKFSWILALIMALTMAFVFVGCKDADTEPDNNQNNNNNNNNNNNSGGGPTYNAAATEIDVVFGTAAGQASIVRTKQDSTDPGTLTYTADNSGYKYLYDGNGSYQNSVLRFKITLASGIKLSDYSKVTFTWKADGLTKPDAEVSDEQKPDNGNFQQDINSNKKLLLLATNSAPEFVPDPSWSDEKALYPLIASTDYFVTNDARIWNGPAGETAGVKGWTPNVNGVEPQDVEISIIPELTEALLGDVWVSIYVHANEGSYTVSDVKFIPGAVDPVVNPTVSGPNAPVYVKPPVPGVAKSFDLNIALANVVTTSVYNGTGTATTGASGGVDVAFAASSNGQRVVFALTPAQTAIINSRVDDRLEVNLQATVTTGLGTDGDKFRYHIGDATEGAGWNATNSPSEGVLSSIIGVKNLTFEADVDKTNNNKYSSRPIHFILQHRDAGAVAINVTAVTITVYVDDLGSGTAPATSYLEATGMQKVMNTEPDFVGTYGSGPHKIEHSILTVSGNGGFWIALPAGTTSSDTVTVTYAAILTEGTEFKLIKKTGSGWTDTTPAGYPSLTSTGAVSPFQITVSELEPNAEKAYFQTNGSYTGKVKIISIAK